MNVRSTVAVIFGLLASGDLYLAHAQRDRDLFAGVSSDPATDVLSAVRHVRELIEKMPYQLRTQESGLEALSVQYNPIRSAGHLFYSSAREGDRIDFQRGHGEDGFGFWLIGLGSDKHTQEQWNWEGGVFQAWPRFWKELRLEEVDAMCNSTGEAADWKERAEKKAAHGTKRLYQLAAGLVRLAYAQESNCEGLADQHFTAPPMRVRDVWRGSAEYLPKAIELIQQKTRSAMHVLTGVLRDEVLGDLCSSDGRHFKGLFYHLRAGEPKDNGFVVKDGSKKGKHVPGDKYAVEFRVLGTNARLSYIRENPDGHRWRFRLSKGGIPNSSVFELPR